MPAATQLSCALSTDRKQATLALTSRDELLGHAVLEAPEVEDLVQRLAEVRTMMAEPIPGKLEPLARLKAIRNPAWTVTAADGPAEAPVLLAIRHPGLGWSANLLPLHEARSLGQALLELANALTS